MVWGDLFAIMVSRDQWTQFFHIEALTVRTIWLLELFGGLLRTNVTSVPAMAVTNCAVFLFLATSQTVTYIRQFSLQTWSPTLYHPSDSYLPPLSRASFALLFLPNLALPKCSILCMTLILPRALPPWLPPTRPLLQPLHAPIWQMLDSIPLFVFSAVSLASFQISLFHSYRSLRLPLGIAPRSSSVVLHLRCCMMSAN